MMGWRDDPDFVAFIKRQGYASDENDNKQPFAPYLYETWKAGKKQLENKNNTIKKTKKLGKELDDIVAKVLATTAPRIEDIKQERDQIREAIRRLRVRVELFERDLDDHRNRLQRKVKENHDLLIRVKRAEIQANIREQERDSCYEEAQYEKARAKRAEVRTEEIRKQRDRALDEVAKLTPALQIAEARAKEALKSCTCDAIDDGPCPIHWRENGLQDQVIAAEEERKKAERERDRLAGVLERVRQHLLAAPVGKQDLLALGMIAIIPPKPEDTERYDDNKHPEVIKLAKALVNTGPGEWAVEVNGQIFNDLDATLDDIPKSERENDAG